MKNKYWYILIILFFILSCKRGSNSAPQVFTKNSYPLAVGNWWKYRLTFCSSGYNPDTFMLKIVSMTNVGPYVDFKCDFIYNGTVTDSGYFRQSDTSLSFTNTFPDAYYSAFPDFHLKFPVSKGQYWPGNYPPKDSILVLGVENTYWSNGHTYGPCFSTNESYILPHNFKVSSMLLTPKIGLISGSIDFQSDTAEVNGLVGVNICESLLLLDYNVQ